MTMLLVVVLLWSVLAGATALGFVALVTGAKVLERAGNPFDVASDDDTAAVADTETSTFVASPVAPRQADPRSSLPSPRTAAEQQQTTSV